MRSIFSFTPSKTPKFSFSINAFSNSFTSEFTSIEFSFLEHRDVWTYIISFCSPRELLALCFTCSFFRHDVILPHFRLMCRNYLPETHFFAVTKYCNHFPNQSLNNLLTQEQCLNIFDRDPEYNTLNNSHFISFFASIASIIPNITGQVQKLERCWTGTQSCYSMIKAWERTIAPHFHSKTDVKSSLPQYELSSSFIFPFTVFSSPHSNVTTSDHSVAASISINCNREDPLVLASFYNALTLPFQIKTDPKTNTDVIQIQSRRISRYLPLPDEFYFLSCGPVKPIEKVICSAREPDITELDETEAPIRSSATVADALSKCCYVKTISISSRWTLQIFTQFINAIKKRNELSSNVSLPSFEILRKQTSSSLSSPRSLISCFKKLSLQCYDADAVITVLREFTPNSIERIEMSFDPSSYSTPLSDHEISSFDNIVQFIFQRFGSQLRHFVFRGPLTSPKSLASFLVNSSLPNLESVVFDSPLPFLMSSMKSHTKTAETLKTYTNEYAALLKVLQIPSLRYFDLSTFPVTWEMISSIVQDNNFSSIPTAPDQVHLGVFDPTKKQKNMRQTSKISFLMKKIPCSSIKITLYNRFGAKGDLTVNSEDRLHDVLKSKECKIS